MALLRGCLIRGADIFGSFVKQSGSVAPILGASAASGSWPPDGWTSVQNANADDANVGITLPFSNFVINSAAYSTAFVGSNGYITFASGSNAYSNLSAKIGRAHV